MDTEEVYVISDDSESEDPLNSTKRKNDEQDPLEEGGRRILRKKRKVRRYNEKLI